MKNTEVEKIHYCSALLGQLGRSNNSRSHFKKILCCLLTNVTRDFYQLVSSWKVLYNIYHTIPLAPKKSTVFKIVKIVGVFKTIRTIAILMCKDVQIPGKSVWKRYD